MQDLDSLMARMEQQESALAEMRRGFAWESREDRPAEGGKPVKRAPSPAREEPEPTDRIVRFAPGRAAESPPAESGDGVSQALPFDLSGGSWRASELLLDEKQDAPDEEDVQCYLIRRRYTGLEKDDQLEQLAARGIPPLSAWDDKAADASPALLYLQAEKHLSEGRVSEQAELEILRLMQGGRQEAAEIHAFYPAFTLLQNEPSQRKLAETLDWLASLPALGERSAVSVLGAAASAFAKTQAEQNAQQSRRFRDRQAGLDREQSQAQREYDAAHRRTDRWR